MTSWLAVGVRDRNVDDRVHLQQQNNLSLWCTTIFCRVYLVQVQPISMGSIVLNTLNTLKHVPMSLFMIFAQGYRSGMRMLVMGKLYLSIN